MDVFEAVAEPSRRALLDVLAEGERSAGELVATLPGLTQPAVSRHLRVLREVGLVDVRQDGQRRIYALRADGLAEIDEWIGRHRRYWTRHLDALEQHLATRDEARHEATRHVAPQDESTRHEATPHVAPRQSEPEETS
ncbi:metalloregulator ArsR/SmtB family transcription factor [Streptomyces sp. SID3343]|uniref:metalloregulator ArsR/SmtB family transcription factor n=1 Tax=Streptomyces sp. SID3343 TaxID=2690260 RepID=UPI00136F011E|nr:metalloregulator ArsR/SmtB family transcription factor [Streptomyces sp. SID3343]